MKIEKVPVYQKDPDSCVNNEYPTSEHALKQPCLMMVTGQRTSGKSYLASKILAQAKKEKTFDIVYMVTPSFNSNKAYFQKYIDEENVYEPTKDSISKVIERVEADRDLWEEYLVEKEMYEKYKKDIKNKTYSFSDDEVIMYDSIGFLDGKKPEWKYEKEEPAKSLLILDDVLGSQAILQSSGLMKIATLNRHQAALKQNHKERSACGLAVIILTQTYRMQSGVSRVLRENLSHLVLFKNKQEAQMKAIREELANVVDEDLFEKAYNYATSKKHGSLCIDFAPKCNSRRFRKNLNEYILFEELQCECENK